MRSARIGDGSSKYEGNRDGETRQFGGAVDVLAVAEQSQIVAGLIDGDLPELRVDDPDLPDTRREIDCELSLDLAWIVAGRDDLNSKIRRELDEASLIGRQPFLGDERDVGRQHGAWIAP